MEEMNRLLVCAPDYYRIAYEINTWMHLEVVADQRLARAQWDGLMAVLEKECGAALERMAPAPEVPDLVFTANAAVIAGRTAILSRFRFPERQPEEAYFERWFLEHGFKVERLLEGLYFEGAGDLLGLDGVMFGGYRQRTDIRAYEHVGRIMDCEIIPVELVDPRFYHIDTCFCPLPHGELLWFPSAFDSYGQTAIQYRVPESRRIAVEESEAARFACNAIGIGEHVVLPDGCPRTMEKVRAFGYTPHAVNLSEFLKAGGAAKCLTLALD
jgi:N-dimethylarginine dimethylaminohydrolase